MDPAAPSPENWTDLTHWDLTDVAALRMGFNPSERSILRKNALVPDDWGFLDKIRHYMPLCSIFAAELTWEAIHTVKLSGNTTDAALRKLGLAMHFLQDAGNPWHTCLLLPIYQRNHTAFEEYVAANMREGFCFRTALLETPPSDLTHHMFTRRIREGTAHIARCAAREFSFLDSSIRSDLAWRNSEKVASVTTSILRNCLQMCEMQLHSFLTKASWDPQPFSLPVAVTWTFIGPDKFRLSE